MAPETAPTGWEDRIFRSPFPVDRLLLWKEQGTHRVSVVFPALDEAATIGPLCELVSKRLIGELGIVDELLVIDSGSTDGTPDIASRAGAHVYRAEDLTDLGEVQGKGDCLWRSLTVVTGTVVLFLDSDTENFHEGFVTDLVAPLLRDDEFVFTKAFYDRPLVTEEEVLATGGARITELTARPLLQLFYPELVGVIQPLAGEYAGRVDALKNIPFFTGYGVEIGMLLDIAERYGVDRIAQVDLGTRVHRNRPIVELGRTSFHVITALMKRLDELGRIKIPDDLTEELVQFIPTPEGPHATTHSLRVMERPPMDRFVKS